VAAATPPRARQGDYGTSPRLTFGKHRGCRLDQVPLGYLAWLIESGVARQYGLIEAARAEIVSRHNLDHVSYMSHHSGAALRLSADIDADVLRRLVVAGRRSLARELHPDIGGDLGDMQSVNAATDFLIDLIGARR
jgi:hypothetical protein